MQVTCSYRKRWVRRLIRNSTRLHSKRDFTPIPGVRFPRLPAELAARPVVSYRSPVISCKASAFEGRAGTFSATVIQPIY